MRSRQELSHRFRQEVANFVLFAVPPSAEHQQTSPFPCLPDPAPVADACRGTAYAAEVVRLADLVVQRQFPLLGTVVETGGVIDWRRDYQRGLTSRARYHRLVPYLDLTGVGDHKIIWELNRHQHLVLLAQAFRLTGRRQFVDEVWAQLQSWWDANPFMRGINWTSALEVAFRTMSWLWVNHLAGDYMPNEMRGRFIRSLFQHGCYLDCNLSIFFSPNTHLLGEAVALHALGRLFPGFPGAKRWETRGAELVAQQMDRQVQDDGTHFEQATYYHLYATDFFLFHLVMSDQGKPYRAKLERMAEYLAAISGGARLLPTIGDDDGGRLFHPFGPRSHFARATLATCGVLFNRQEWLPDPTDLHEQGAWWLGEPALKVDRRPRSLPSAREVWDPQGATRDPGSRLFPNAGVAIMTSGHVQVIVDAGSFGPGSAGHSHSDTLSLVVRLGAEEILIDPGTCTYVDWETRNLFRGSAAHNTVRIDRRDQAIPQGPFRWKALPKVELLRWVNSPSYDFVEARCSYQDPDRSPEASFSHRRGVLLLKRPERPELLFVCDRIEGPLGDHILEQFWHPGERIDERTPQHARIGIHSCLVVPPGDRIEREVGGRAGWRSICFGQRAEAPVLVISRETTLPAQYWTVVDFSGAGESAGLRLDPHRLDTGLYVDGTRTIEVCLSNPIQVREGSPA